MRVKDNRLICSCGHYFKIFLEKGTYIEELKIKCPNCKKSFFITIKDSCLTIKEGLKKK
jgi:phage FluMu protein Com